MTIFNLALSYSQNLYPEKYNDCSLTSFCLDCGDTKAEPPESLMSELLDKFDKKSLSKEKGGIDDVKLGNITAMLSRIKPAVKQTKIL